MRILVTSSKGGIGKSTVAAGLAQAFVKRGKRVLLLDCDLGNRCLDMFLGLTDSVLFDVGDVAAGRATAKEALLEPWGLGGFYFCPAPSRYSPEDIDGGRLIKALTELEAETDADVAICDTAGMVCAPEIAREWADTALVISTQQPASVRAAENTAMLLGDEGLSDSRLVISNFEWKAAEKGKRSGILDVIDETGVRCVGVVPHDRTLMLAGESGRPLAKNSVAARVFDNIAARLEGYSVRLFFGLEGISKNKIL